MNERSYHGFAPGEHVPVDRIIALCDRHIRDGHVKPTSIPEKQRYLQAMRASGHAFLIWTPMSSGWESSPFNLNCWRNPVGEPIRRRHEPSLTK